MFTIDVKGVVSRVPFCRPGRDALPKSPKCCAAFDSARPACFSWLGVTQYLTHPAIDDTLRFVAALPAPSTLVLTFIVPESVVPPEEHAATHQLLEMAARVGEPFLTFFHPDELRARLHELGFARVVHLTPTEANARYFAGRRDGLQARYLEHVMAATV